MKCRGFWRALAFGCVIVSLASMNAWAQGLKVQYRNPSTDSNIVRPNISIVNTGTATVALSTLTARYWYTVDGSRPQTFVCDWTARGCTNVTAKFVAVSPAVTGADFYMEVGFTAGMGSLAPGQSTGEIQERFNKDNWSNYTQPGDYSYDPTKTALTDWDHITLYQNGVLVWGAEPTGNGNGGCGAAPATPAGVAASAISSSQINVSWNAVTPPTGCTVTYSVFRSTTTGFTPSAANQVASGLTTTSFPNTGLTAGTTFFYRVEAIDSFGASAPSAQVSATTPPNNCAAVPSVPTGLTATAASSSQINLAWTAVTAPANCTVTYSVFQSTTTGFTPSAANQVATGLTTASFQNMGLTASTAFFYVVEAVDGAGASAPSAQATATTLPAAGFSILVAPRTYSIAQGGTATGTVTVTRTGGFTGAVALSATGQPTGITVSFNPVSVTGTTSTVTFAVAATAAAGMTPIIITGTGGGFTGATEADVTVPGGTNTAPVFRVDPTGKITKDGQPFPVRCGNWFGLEGHYETPSDAVNPRGAPMEQFIGNTFWANGGAGTGRTIAQTMSEISAQGINMIRLPLVPQTLDANDPQGKDPVLKNHPSVRIANSRLALETMIKAADAAGIAVLLDMHSCSNYVGWRKGRLQARPPYADATRDNYDFKREDSSCAATNNPATVTRIQPYDETTWLANLQTLAGLEQQLGVKNIIGIDLYNEPWDYTWADWKKLSEDAYQAINAVNPNILIFMEGVSGTADNQDGTPDTITQVPFGDASLNVNWGENLFEAGANVPNIPKNQLVFSPHTYGPSVFVQPQFMDPAQTQCAGLSGDAAGDAKCNLVINPTLLKSGWDQHFGYLKDQGFAVVVGEFGGNLDWPGGQAAIRDRNRWGYLPAGFDGQWQNAFVDYMVSRGIEGCYWSINPESGDTAGWYGHAYDPVTNTAGWGEWRPFDARKTTLLNRLWGR